MYICTSIFDSRGIKGCCILCSPLRTHTLTSELWLTWAALSGNLGRNPSLGRPRAGLQVVLGLFSGPRGRGLYIRRPRAALPSSWAGFWVPWPATLPPYPEAGPAFGYRGPRPYLAGAARLQAGARRAGAPQARGIRLRGRQRPWGAARPTKAQVTT